MDRYQAQTIKALKQFQSWAGCSSCQHADREKAGTGQPCCEYTGPGSPRILPDGQCSCHAEVNL